MNRVLLVISAALLSACGSTTGKCNPQNCNTCCDATDSCVTFTGPLACGSGGHQCNTCGNGQQCSLGICTGGGSNVGGGTGSGGGGGTTGGGGGSMMTDGGTGGGTGGGTMTGGGGGSSTGGGGGTTTGGGGGSTPTCDFQPVTANFTFDRDVKVVTVNATLTVNGGQAPNSPNVFERGSLIFRNTASGASTSVSVPPTGAATVSAVLFGGTYDVTFASTTDSDLVGLPIGSQRRVATGVTITSTQTFMWNLPVVTATGTVTINGGQMPNSPNVFERGEVIFTDPITSQATSASIAPTGAGTFSTLIFGGSYDVRFASTTDSDLVGLPIGSSARLASGVTISTQPLMWNLAVVTASGTLTVNGGQMPNSVNVFERGEVIFRNRDTATTTVASVPPTGAGSFSTLLFGGSYDATFASTTDSDLVGLPIGSTVRVASGSNISSTQTFTWNLSVVTASGALTVNGGQMPNSPNVSERGEVVFRNVDTGSQTVATVAPSGVGSYSALLFGGSYAITFATTTDSDLVGLPIGAVTSLSASSTITSTQTFNWNLPVSSISGTITVNGGQMPNSPNVFERGEVIFRHRTTGAATVASVPPTGAGAYSTLLFGGAYDATFATTTDSDLAGLPIGGRAQLQSNVTVNAPTTLNFNVPVLTATGRLTVNGGQMPNSPNVFERGELIFRHKLTGSEVAASIAPTNAATFSALLFGGPYDVIFTTTTDSDLVGLPIGTQTQLARGCITAGACTANTNDLTGIWSMFYASSNYGTWTLNLTESSGLFSGSYVASSFQGQVTGGMHTGNTALITVTSPGCTIEINGQLDGACLMTGLARCIGQNQSTFTAIR